MLIEISSTVINKIISKKCSYLEMHAFDNIIKQHINHNHLVYFGRKDLIKLINSNVLLSPHVIKYLEVYERKFYSMLGSIKSNVVSKILVDNIIVPTVEKQDDKVTYIMPLIYFEESDRINKSHIFSEDEEDCEFYKYISKYRKKKYLGSIFDIQLENISSNGGKIGRDFKRKVDSGKFVLAIVDSDIKNGDPKALGDTPKIIEKTFSEIDYFCVSELYILPVQEKENLLPLEIYKYLCNGNKSVNQLMKLKEFNQDYLIYFDYKQGLSSHNYHSYFEDLFLIDGVISKEGTSDSQMFSGSKEEFEKISSNIKKEEKPIYLIKGLGQSPMGGFEEIGKLVSYLEKRIGHKDMPSKKVEEIKREIELIKKFDDCLIDLQKVAWNKISNYLFSYGLALNKTATSKYVMSDIDQFYTVSS